MVHIISLLQVPCRDCGGGRGGLSCALCITAFMLVQAV